MDTQSQLFQYSSTLHTGSSGATLPIDQGESHRQPTTIDMLLDDVLLGIFGFCEGDDDDRNNGLVWDWHFLVHVCRRWRQIIFASPHSLNLKILCTHQTPVRKHLGIWPAFPIVIDYYNFYSESGTVAPDDEDNVIAALDSKHLDRVCFVGLYVTSSQLDGKDYPGDAGAVSSAKTSSDCLGE